MRRPIIIAGALAAVLLVSAMADSHARLADNVTVHVSSAAPNTTVEFDMRYFGAGIQDGNHGEHLTTPYDVTVPGKEIYALFRQTGGTGTMRVDVHGHHGVAGSATGAIGMIVMSGDRIGVTGFDH